MNHRDDGSELTSGWHSGDATGVPGYEDERPIELVAQGEGEGICWDGEAGEDDFQRGQAA
jgi:hypothetical protein